MSGGKQHGPNPDLGQSKTGVRLSVCQAPHGLHEHVEVDGPAPETCFADCDCTPRVYVALDEVLGIVGNQAFAKYDPADNARRALIRRFVRGEAT